MLKVYVQTMDKKLKVEEIATDEWSFHFWFGLECGYPLCCIIWYCDSVTNSGKQDGSVWDKVLYNEFMNNPDYKPTWKAIIERKAEHNQCPECLARSYLL